MDKDTCHEVSRKPNVSTSMDRLGSAGITVVIACADEEAAQAEARRIGQDQRRPVYNRPWKNRGRRVTRYSIYRDDVTTNVVVDGAPA